MNSIINFLPFCSYTYKEIAAVAGHGGIGNIFPARGGLHFATFARGLAAIVALGGSGLGGGNFSGSDGDAALQHASDAGECALGARSARPDRGGRRGGRDGVLLRDWFKGSLRWTASARSKAGGELGLHHLGASPLWDLVRDLEIFAKSRL